MTIHDLLGKRCLVKSRYSIGDSVREVRVKEISPTGNWCLLLDTYGSMTWIPVADVSMVEELEG